MDTGVVGHGRDLIQGEHHHRVGRADSEQIL